MSGSERLHLLFVGGFPPPGRTIYGGQVTACASLMRSSFPNRVTLTLIDSTQISNPPPSLFTRALLSLRRSCRFVYQFERRRPDAVLLFVAIGWSLTEKGLMAWYARMRGVPALTFPRGGQLMADSRESMLERWWLRLAFGGARYLLCQSRTWQDFAVSVLGLPPERAPVIPNWTATPELLAIGRDRVHRRDGPVRLLFLGWFDREKGVGELLDACRDLAPGRAFIVNVVGEGNYSHQGRAFVHDHGLEQVVRFHGWLTGQPLHEMFAASDVLVLPSWNEGLPNAMIEAMAARLAVIVTAVGAIPGVVAADREALLIPPRDPVALRRALERMIDEPDLRERLADAAYRIAQERFAVEPAVTRIMAALHHAVGRAPVADLEKKRETET